MERSPSNYRLYPEEMVERIQWIEEQKQSGKHLTEIGELLKTEAAVTEDYEEISIQDIRLQMRRLEDDVTKMLETMDDQEKQQLKRKINPESISLIQSLILLLQ